jgi:hypothetical protein
LAKRHPHWERETFLLSQRDHIIDEILLRSQAGTSSPFTKKASALLTRVWARADWQSREEILRAARWFLDVGRGHTFGSSRRSR